MCDLASEDVQLGSFMPRLGYDTCMDDGSCDPCLDEEKSLAYCQSTGLRQRVICAGCHVPKPPLPFCLPGFRLFWQANATEMATALTAVAAAGNASSAPSAGLFFRGCSGDDAAARHFLRGPLGDEEDLGAAMTLTEATSAPTAGGGSERPRPAPDESSEVLLFIVFNAVLLAASAFSLKRQQHKQHEEINKVLYTLVGGAEPGPPAPRKEKERRRGDSLGASAAAASAASAAAAPESIGRSLQAVAARAGNALELAVLGEGSKSLQQKDK